MTDINQTAKAQSVRAFDVLALGPFMITAGLQARNKWIGLGLTLAGVFTIAYNWENFKSVRTAKENQHA